MTVQLLKSYQGNPAGTIMGLEAGTETALIRGNLAVAYSATTSSPATTVVAQSTPFMADAIRNYYPFMGATAQIFLIPPQSQVNYVKGTILTIAQRGAGSVTITPGSGVTINVASTLTLVTKGQYSYVQIINVDTNVWDAFGALGG